MRYDVACLLLLLAPLAAADTPAGRVDLGSWVVDSGEALPGYDLSAGLDLADTVRLEVTLSEAAERAARVGYGQLSWGVLRLGGGWVGDDGGLHLGFGPQGELALGRSVSLAGGVDAALGVARFERSTPSRRSGPWRDLPDGVDGVSATLATFLELRARPARPLRLSLRGYGDAFLAQAPADPSSPLSELSRDSDLSLASALSDVALGGHGQITLDVLRARAMQSEVFVALSYREAWDWIHLDPTLTLFARSAGLNPYDMGEVPWRSTRRLALHLHTVLPGGLAAGVTLDGQHVQGSTTTMDFSDRNGWSVGARLTFAWEALRLELGGRTHLGRSELEEVIGGLPRNQLLAAASLDVYDDGATRVRLQAQAQWTVRDAYGLPTPGHRVAGGLSIQFGGTRAPRRIDPIDVAALTVHRAGPAPSASLPDAESPDPGTTEHAERALPTRQEAESLFGSLSEADVDRLLASAPEDLDLEALAASSSADKVETALQVLRPVVALGHGRRGSRLGVIEGRATRYAITERMDRASLEAVTQRYDPPDDLFDLTPGSLEDFLERSRADGFSLFAPGRRRHELLLQARGAWSQHMRRALSGR